jgi:hypothetical protein
MPQMMRLMLVDYMLSGLHEDGVCMFPMYCKFSARKCL